MIIVKIGDGFGNQLFMYACGYAVAKRLNTELVLDVTLLETHETRKLELDNLNVTYSEVITTGIRKCRLLKRIKGRLIRWNLRRKYNLFVEKQGYYDDSIISAGDRTYLCGYWQSEKYFQDYRTDIRKLFTPHYPQSMGCREYKSKVQQCMSIAIHVRRGDYQGLGICLDHKYYEQAIKHIQQSVADPYFFVFSDNISDAKNMLADIDANLIYVTYESENMTLDDFFIMKECRHQIIANSSFSWWAAWLNDYQDKIVVCPEWRQWSGDFYPSQWHKIPV